MTYEEKKAIEQVKKLLENATPFDMPPSRYNTLETMVNLIEKQDKLIDLMAEHIDEQNDILCDYDSSIAYLPCDVTDTIDKCLKDECKNCVKEHFRKKVENERNKV